MEARDGGGVVEMRGAEEGGGGVRCPLMQT